MTAPRLLLAAVLVALLSACTQTTASRQAGTDLRPGNPLVDIPTHGETVN